MNPGAFRRFSIGVLAYNLGVILWGAYVRATGAGAGCGKHWPTCQGEIIPRDPTTATLIEYTHRATSGLALISVVLLVLFAFRAFPSGSPVRRGAIASLFFMLTEAAVGAALVLFELVAQNKSIARAEFLSVHLTNTFLLLASIAVTVYWAFGGGRVQWRAQGTVGRLLAVAVIGTILLGVSGAITALGDTLFPASSLAEGMRQDFSATAHVFIRLRRWHPVLAVLMDLYVTVVALTLAEIRPRPAVRWAAFVVVVLFFLQLCIGVANLVMLAPIPLQMLHLLNADLTWIALVILTASALEAPEGALAPSPPGPPSFAR